MMRAIAISCCLLLLCACETVRTVYDEAGNEVKPSSSGGETDLTSHFEKEFASSFSEKKNDQGVPQATSGKVSRYQKDLDSSSRLDKQFSTGSYAGATRDEVHTMSFSGAGKTYNVKEAYSGAMGSAIERDLHPAFATGSRGIYGTEDSYAGDEVRSALEGMKSRMNGQEYVTHSGRYSREDSSGYVESRRDNTPPPRIISRDEYYRKTVRETRALLGRDEEKQD